ncbi:MAG: MBL fold metallo-hydrolase [Candidatus Eisenbacteria bacterium]|nr:MBL fold metallo-hydrolase [Candidatus Eisenbacteria bacterium]
MTDAQPPQLDVIDLDHDLTGYREFLSCWVARTPQRISIVDPGPMSSLPLLQAGLDRLGIERIDLILLTHIHLDHAGATGKLLERHPQARVVCHEKGIRHIVDPTKLWEGSRAVLGEVAEAYGPPPPVPETSIATYEESARAGVRVIPTPGHAAHHLAFEQGGVLFSGELAGTRHPLPEHDYMRPATPPRFILEVAVDSIDRVLALDPLPGRMVFAHYGVVDETRAYLQAARRQLIQWTETVRELSCESTEDLQRRAHARWLETDAYYAQFPRLPEDIREREYHYMGQSVDGMLGYVQAGRG